MIDLPCSVVARETTPVATWRAVGRTARVRLGLAGRRVRQRWRTALFRAARLAGAAVAAYLTCEAFGLVDPPPLTGALTAILVVQATASSTLSSGVDRVLSVVSGVALATGFVAVVGLTWWSLGLLVAVSIIVGQLLRLGPNLIEVPISAMLVLGVGYAAGAQASGLNRIVETLIGAAVGVLVNVVFPPAVRTRNAGQAVQRLAEEIAALLEEAAQGLGRAESTARSVIDSGEMFPTDSGWFSIPSVDRSSGDSGLTTDATARWIDDARRLNRHVPRVDRALTHAEQSRRLNLRALGDPHSARSLRGGLEALEMCSIAVRGLFRAVDDWVRGGMREPDHAFAERARRAWAELLGDLAVVIRVYGAFLRAEVEGASSAQEAAVVDALDRMRLNRVRYADALLADPREHPDLWEVDSAVAGLVDRMLLELDTTAHAQLWQERRREIIDLHIATELLDRLRPARRPNGPGADALHPDRPNPERSRPERSRPERPRPERPRPDGRPADGPRTGRAGPETSGPEAPDTDRGTS
jgi:Aromatic acid exporter family member 1